MSKYVDEITVENEKIDSKHFFSIGFCPEIKCYLLCVHIPWIVGYNRYYLIGKDDIALYENEPKKFCQKYNKEINSCRTKKLMGAGALRDYDFRCLPDEVLSNLNGYPSFKGYEYRNEILYARVKINDSCFCLSPIYDEK